MDREINLDSIRALEKQIQEHERAIIRLKRARNSLLNVSTLLPPEVLGSIFRWNVIPDGDFGGLPKASYNFLLVCHHWFQVASSTPELWGFWGNSIEDWARRHACRRTIPLDLVLTGSTSDHLDDTLRDALQDRAARDTIRRVHLKGAGAELLNSVISSITTKGEEAQSNNMESFILWNTSWLCVDVSDFFSRYHFPKLHHLYLCGFNISSWDLLGSRTTSLTSLTLINWRPQSSTPTLSQLLPILSANPNLQCLDLSDGLVPHADSDRPFSKIQLCRLKRLTLTSDFRCAFGLLNRLELPDKMDSLMLILYECSPLDLPQTLGPYLGNLVRRWSPDGSDLSAYPGLDSFFVQVGDVCEGDLTRVQRSVAVDGVMNVLLGEEEADKLCFDIVAHIPKEKIVKLTALPILRSEELCIQMYNVTHLHLEDVDLSTWFVEPDTREPHVFKDLLRGLRSITITESRLSGGDWSPLTNFLIRRAAAGNRISSLWLSCCPRMDESVVESIRRVVEVFEDEGSDDGGDDSSSLKVPPNGQVAAIALI
jgi:hypothetical protein